MSKFDLAKIKDSVVDIFGFGSKNLIGLDVGQHAIKLVELSSSGKGKNKSYKVVNFDYEILPEGTILDEEIQNTDDFLEALEGLFSRSGIRNKNICLGVSGQYTTCKRVQIGANDEEELAGQIEWEAEQYIPFDQDDATITHAIIGHNPGGGYDVVISAIHNSFGEKFQNLCSDAGLKVKIVDLNLFALNNVFEHIHYENLADVSSGILLIDFGAQTTKLLIYKNQGPIFTREMNIGGGNITEEIQRQLGQSFTDSEELKIFGDDQGNLAEEILEIIELTLESFMEEIKKTIDFFLTASSEQSLSLCYITGGSSSLPGLKEALENSLGITVEKMNLLDKYSYEEKNFDEEKLNTLVNYGVIATGLAMRSLDE